MAQAIQISRVGGPEVLELGEVAVDAPGEGEVRIRHRAIGVNYIDIYHRIGLYPQALPFTPGMEGAGTIEEVGPGVQGFEKGDRVGYAGLIGSYSETRLARADRLVKIPEDISFETAAALLLKGMTAHMLLQKVYDVQRGDEILVHAAAGGLGLIVCQWAAAIGATVIGTVSSDQKAKLAQQNGCAHRIIYTQEDFVDRVNKLTNGRKVSVVYDSVGKETFLRSLDCLRPHGLMVLCGQSSGAVPPVDLGILAAKGSLYVTRPVLFSYISTREELQFAAEEVFAMQRSGKINVAINQRYSLSEAAQAHRDLEGRRTTGASILVVEH